MPVKIMDIAKQLGISCATVSMALNDRPGVNPQTKQKVLDYAREVHYTGYAAHKQRKSKGILSFLVYKRHGKVLTDTQFFAELIESVEHAARSMDYNITLTYCLGKDQAQSAVQAIQAAKPDGLLLLATEMGEEDFAPFQALAMPMTVLDCDLFDCGSDKVLINNKEGIWKAIKYLYERGHRDIGYLHSSFSIRNFEQRAHGYCHALQRLNLVASKNRTFSVEPTVEGAYEDMCRILEKGRDLPSAFIADNDIIAFGAVKALKKYGYRIPEDVSVIGFDDVPICTFTEPELTSINVPKNVLGASAVQQLVLRIKKPNSPFIQIAVGTNLIERKSVSKLN